MSDIKPLNRTTKTLAHVSQLSIDFQPLYTKGILAAPHNILPTIHNAAVNCTTYYHEGSLSPMCSRLSLLTSCNVMPHTRSETVSWVITVCGRARRPHFSLAIISLTVQLWTYVFWVISVYFNIRNTLPKSGTFLPGHSVFISLSTWPNV